MIMILAVISISAICFCLLYIYIGWRRLANYNQLPLHIKTFDGSNSPYHPSVLYKENGFAGYNYIMSETPFYLSLPNDGENYRDQFECPSIHFSNDGIHWEERFKNPISNLTDQQRSNKDYFSDPDLIKTPNGIECWYRINRRYGSTRGHDKISLLRKKSKDGILWSEEEEIINLEIQEENSSLGRIVISPAVIFENGKYKLWYVDNIHKGKGHIRYAESDPSLKNWEKSRIIEMRGHKVFPWHIHLFKDEHILWLTVYDRENITLWKGNNELVFSYIKTLLNPSKVIGSFFSHGLYRACMLKTAEGKYRLYFSANDLFKTYIGIMEGDTPENLFLKSTDKGVFRTFLSYVDIYVKTMCSEISRKMRYIYKRICDLL